MSKNTAGTIIRTCQTGDNVYFPDWYDRMNVAFSIGPGTDARRGGCHPQNNYQCCPVRRREFDVKWPWNLQCSSCPQCARFRPATCDELTGNHCCGKIYDCSSSHCDVKM